MNQLNDSLAFQTKKQQYLEQDIDDKRGTFKYTDDAVEYKKARKRF